VDDPAPTVIFQRFGDYAIELGVYFWINTEVNNPLRAKDAAIQVVNAAFLENKIEMPTPYQALIRKSE
jgi:small-conductance mechanosensitive channel